MSARRVLERLAEAECTELLADGGMGRLVFNSRYGPTALPVVYKVDGGSLVLGTWDPVFDQDLRTGIEHADYQVAVEADQINRVHRLTAFRYDRKTKASLLCHAADLDQLLSECYPDERLADDSHQRYRDVRTALRQKTHSDNDRACHGEGKDH